MNFMKRGFLLKCFLSLLLILISFVSGILFGLLTEPKSEEERSEFEDSIAYINENKDTQIRYKYMTSYETVEKNLNEIVVDKPVYSLYVNDIAVSDMYTLHKDNIPVVSDIINVQKGQKLESTFKVKLNKSINKDRIRIDVRIVIEELIDGKWVPVYQVVFMERGPYWSLDKGPIETLKE